MPARLGTDPALFILGDLDGRQWSGRYPDQAVRQCREGQKPRSQPSNLPYRLRAVDSRNPRTRPRARNLKVCCACALVRCLVLGLDQRAASNLPWRKRPGGSTSRPILTGSITIGRRNDWLVGSHSFQRSRYLARSWILDPIGCEASGRTRGVPATKEDRVNQQHALAAVPAQTFIISLRGQWPKAFFWTPSFRWPLSPRQRLSDPPSRTSPPVA
jgi:hypothetical protein